jgi:hypothetical protein
MKGSLPAPGNTILTRGGKYCIIHYTPYCETKCGRNRKEYILQREKQTKKQTKE